jgi:hypothetical protein
MEDKNNDDGLSSDRLDYLTAKYIFRYPYTFSSLKWGFTLGSFFGLHSYIRTRSLKTSFTSWI